MKLKTADELPEGRSDAPARALRLAERPAPVPPRAPVRDVAIAALLALGAVFEARPGTARRAWVTAVPVIIVNYVAFRAQLRFWQAHLDRPDALLVSVALESIAVYWAWQAHQAVMADDSALRLKLAAYGMALIIGALNYSHYMRPGWRPTVAAVTFGMMSVISPWLWAANSRRSSRDMLKARNRIEDHAVRLGLTRWFWHAYRCVQVMHKATWTGETSPAEAIKLWQPRKDQAGQPRPPAAVAPVQSAAPRTPPASRARKPRPPVTAVAGGRAVLSPALAVLSQAEESVLATLTAAGHPLPGERELASAEFSGSRRAARRVLTAAKTRIGDGDGNRA